MTDVEVTHTDPVLQPLTTKHLQLGNRIMDCLYLA